MGTRQSPTVLTSFDIYVKAAGSLSILVGVAVLIGWYFDIGPLKSILPEAATMKFNTALSFSCAGISLWLLRNEESRANEKRAGQLFAVLVLTISVLTVIEYLFEWDLGIDQLFIKDLVTSAEEFPGRMSQITAVCFALCGGALLLLGSKLSQYFSIGVVILSLLAVIGYLFDYQSLYRLAGYGSIALHTALTFLILSLGILAGRPALGIMQVMTSSLEGGKAIRLLLPLASFLIIFLGWLIVQAEHVGLIDTRNTIVVLIVALLLLYFPAIYLYADRINRAQEQVMHLNRLYATLSHVNQAIVHVKDQEILYQIICKAVVDFGKFHFSWIGLLDPSTGTVTPVAMQGVGTELLRSLRININQPPFDLGLVGLALRNEHIVTSDDVQTDERMQHWREESRKQGYRSAAAVPFFHKGKVAGVLNLYADERGFFKDEAELHLLEEIGIDISFALDSMDAEQARAHLAAIVESSNDAIITKDLNGIVTSWNEGAERIFEYKAVEMIGQPIVQLIPPDRIEEEEYILSQIRQGQLVGHFETVRLRKDGVPIDMSITVSPVKDATGRIIGASKIARDIMQRKQIESRLEHTMEDLQRSNAELEQFAYVASHDLQEPLRTITGMVQLLKKRYQGRLDPRADEYIGFTVEATSRMQALINDLLEFSRVDRRGQAFEVVNMNDVVQAVLRNLARTIRKNDAVVTYDALPNLNADLSQMARLLQNLIGNAIKFRNERPPQIHIKAVDLKNAWQFSIQDNGIGIKPEYYERIFVIFQRLHTRSEYPGTGIGLALCKKIVERHGGRIWVESQPGKGSTFFFTIAHEVIQS